MIRTTIILALTVLTAACTDEIVFDTGAARDYLIVDGFITDAPGPHHVKLSRSASFKSVLEGGEEPPVSGAFLTIEDDLDNQVTLQELEPGNYMTPHDFVGVPGRTYTLRVVINDQEQYVSTPQLLTPSGEMSNVSYEVIENTSGSIGAVQYEHKIRYSIDYSFSSDDQFYKWDWEETYMFPTLCKITAGINCDENPRRLVDSNVPIWCYVRDSLPENFINLSSARDFTTDMVQDHEFDVIDLSFKFFNTHSINMLQYSISEEAYNFWKRIDQQVNTTGSIFDPAPVQLTGNMTNPNDDTEIVLGFFGAYGVTSERLFIQAADIAEGVPGITCPEIVNFHGEGPPSFCDDCRWWADGVPEKPDYWLD